MNSFAFSPLGASSAERGKSAKQSAAQSVCFVGVARQSLDSNRFESGGEWHRQAQSFPFLKSFAGSPITLPNSTPPLPSSFKCRMRHFFFFFSAQILLRFPCLFGIHGRFIFIFALFVCLLFASHLIFFGRPAMNIITFLLLHFFLLVAGS